MFSTNEQKLQDIKALMLPVMKKKLSLMRGQLSPEQFWTSQVPAYLKLFDMNMKWSFRLIKPDIPKEIREIEHQIRQLKVSRDMLELDKEYVLNKLKRMLRKFSESSLTRYIQLKHEFSGRTSEEMKITQTHNKYQSQPEKQVEKTEISTIQAFSAKMQRFAEKDIPERVRQLNRVIIDTKMSPKFFESTLEEATDMMKKAVEPYTDEELMIWESTYTNLWRRKLECDPKLTYDEKMRLLKENYIQSQNDWLKRKMSPSEAEKFWDQKKINETASIDICDEEKQLLQKTTPRVEYGRKYEQSIQKNDLFVARMLMPDINYEVRQLNDAIQGLYTRKDAYYLGRNYVAQLFQSIVRASSVHTVAKWIELRKEIYNNSSKHSITFPANIIKV
ncbi:hypothetical protein WR25_21337 [Diploscapter pachys]|uniref:Uncharacterized protein n=1 Tax=Diploscapter pachys TaxID=2018661 RepID=A0A2A2JQV0_9BILA|nr:hypothetical protein WR25_21337 [Diploscapter pachys]